METIIAHFDLECFLGNSLTAEVHPRSVSWQCLSAAECLALQRRQGRLLLTDLDKLRGEPG